MGEQMKRKEKIINIYSLSIQINFNLTGDKRSPLFYILVLKIGISYLVVCCENLLKVLVL